MRVANHPWQFHRRHGWKVYKSFLSMIWLCTGMFSVFAHPDTGMFSVFAHPGTGMFSVFAHPGTGMFSVCTPWHWDVQCLHTVTLGCSVSLHTLTLGCLVSLHTLTLGYSLHTLTLGYSVSAHLDTGMFSVCTPWHWGVQCLCTPGQLSQVCIHPSTTWIRDILGNACVHRLDLGLYSHLKEFLG